MKNEDIINVENISKIYKLYDSSTDRLKEALNPFKKKYHRDFYALKNVSFSVKKGETLGIIGKNGAGKSTLLKLLTGVLTQTSGKINVKGKISSLLELGAGFNPELSGMDNVYFNGAIMGFSKKDIDSKLEDILSFADIGDFINQPIKSYSSGMVVRLAFAVFINFDPEVLIIDEALSVGDMFFQEKCINKMKEFVSGGKVVVFVSHSMPSIRNFCDRAIWIKDGENFKEGRPDLVCEEYEKFYNGKNSQISPKSSDGSSYSNLNNLSKYKIYIESLNINKSEFITDEDIKINIKLGFNKDITKYGVGVLVHDNNGKLITVFNTVRDDIYFNKTHKNFSLVIPKNDFLAGKYFVSASICDDTAMFSYDKVDYAFPFVIKDKKNNHFIPVSSGLFRAKHSWVY